MCQDAHVRRMVWWVALIGCRGPVEYHCQSDQMCGAGKVCNTTTHQCVDFAADMSPTDSASADLGPALDMARTWGVESPPGMLRGDVLGIWGSDADGVVYAVTSLGEIAKRNITWRNDDTLATTALYGVWGSSGTDVYAVGADSTGQHGLIVHRMPGGTWLPVTWPMGSQPAPLSAVSGAGPSNIVAVGDQTTVVQYKGSSWRIVQNSNGGRLTAVRVFPTEVLVVGEQGVVLNGPIDHLVPMQSGTTQTLYGLGAPATGPWVAVGNAIVLSAPADGPWSTFRAVTPDSVEWDAVWVNGPNDYLVAGSDGVHQVSGPTDQSWVQLIDNRAFCIWVAAAGDIYVGGRNGDIWHGR